MKAYKRNQFLVFEFGDGRDVKYNLATGEALGLSGRVVKDICIQLRGYTILDIINCFEDENYKNFLHFINIKINGRPAYRQGYTLVSRITNVGTFLSMIKNYPNYEQFFACGLKNISVWEKLSATIADVPKGLIKICRECDIELNDNLIFAYKKRPDDYLKIMGMDYFTLQKNEIMNKFRVSIISSYPCDKRFVELIDRYRYDIETLLKYIDYLMTYEAVGAIDTVITEVHDYARMCKHMSNKYEKYPKNFLTVHKITSSNFNKLKAIFDEDKFATRIDKDLEYSYNDYVFIYPEKTQDIKDEAVQQGNCVASYISKVIDGDCHIMFMRHKDSKDISLVTLQVVGNKVVQAKGRYNREATVVEQEAINMFNKKLERLGK